MNKHLVRVCLILAAVLAAGWRQEYCSQDTVCMIMEQNDATVRILFRNELPMDNQMTTVSFETRSPLVNLSGTARFPHTRIVKGPDPAEIASFTITDPSKKWNANVYYFWQYGTPATGKESERSYRLPYAPGKKFRVGQAFNGTITHFDDTRYAVDFLMPPGTPIHAAREGVVIATEDRQGEGKFEAAYRDKSNYVLILHDDGSVGRYYHLVKGGVKVRVADHVAAGDLIGLSGNSGYSNVPHLHFEVSRPVDGRTKQTIPFTFVTDAGDREVPQEGFLYQDRGLQTKRAIPVCIDDVVLCRDVKDLKPVGIIDSLTPDETVQIYVPIERPGVHTLNALIYPEGKKENARRMTWTTQKTWWYTTYTLPGRSLTGGSGPWRIDLSVNTTPLGTISFTLKPSLAAR